VLGSLKAIDLMILFLKFYYLRIKMRNQARRQQEEMALDLKLLEDALATTKTEEEDRLKRKV
jgi:hypothetical protein